MGIKMSQKNPVVYDGYVKYEEADIHRSAIIQDFQDNEKKIKMADWIFHFFHFGFFSVKFVMGYPCVRHHILFYIHDPAILHFLS